MRNKPLMKKTKKVKSKNTKEIPNNPILLETETKLLDEVELTKKKLGKIKEDLDVIIDAINSNSSLLSKAASIWGEIPLWQKITGGILLIVPLFVIGIAAAITTFLTLSLFTLLTYTASSLLLDNHHRQNEKNIKILKTGFSNLADVLIGIMSSLDIFREQLAQEIDRFQKENNQLTEQTQTLKKNINQLNLQLEQLTNTEQKLHLTQEELEQTCASLKSVLEEQTQLVEKTQKELNQTLQDYQHNQNQLSEKIVELNDVKIKTDLEIEKTKKIAMALNGAVQTLSKAVIKDDEQKASFQHRLEEFLNNKEKSFEAVAERICDAEHELSLVKDELKLSVVRYQELLEKQGALIERHERQLEKTDNQPITEQSQKIRHTTSLKTMGFYSVKEPISLLNQQKENTFAINVEIH